MDFERLPDAWLRQFTECLPAHLKLRIRCCSRKLQRLVDQHGVGLHVSVVLNPVVALQLSAPYLTSLKCHTLQQACDSAATSTHAVQHALSQLTGGMPSLQQVVINPLQQTGVVDALLAHRPPALKHIKICSRYPMISSCAAPPEQLQQVCTGLLSLSALAPQLTCLEVDHATYKQAPELIHSILLQPLPHLDTLILQPNLMGGNARRCMPVIPAATWQRVFEPLLLRLTRLEFGSRANAGVGLGGDQADSPAAMPEGPASPQTSEAATAGMAATSAPPTHAAASTPTAALLDTSAEHSCGRLLQLKCSGEDSPEATAWALSWLGLTPACRSLTALTISWCSAGELDCDVLAQLQQLQTLSLHYYTDEFLTAEQLGPLSACCRLTQLKVDGLLVEQPAPAGAAAGEAAAAAAGGTQQGVSGLQGVSRGVLPQLTSLQRLTANLMCRQPLASFTPGLTRLKDADFDPELLDLPSSIADGIEHPPAGHEALAGLTGLQVLCVNIWALVRHVSQCPQHLTALQELHVDMVGGLSGTDLDPGGLTTLPHLTKLVMTLDTKGHSRDLTKTYTTAEDLLLWKNQHAVRVLRLRGSALLGGFLVEGHLLQQLPAAMPQLHRVELVKMRDLTRQQLGQLVGMGVCRELLVQGCSLITDRDCVELEEQAAGSVVVEYSL